MTHPWITHYPPSLRWDEPVDPKLVYAMLDNAVAQFPTHRAIDFLGKHYDYATLGDRVNRAASGFQALGVRKGVQVGIFLPNCPQSVISYFAILKAGGTVVNFSPLYSQDELRHQVEDSQVEILVTLDLQALYPKAQSLLGCGKLRHLVVGSLVWALPFPKNMLFPVVKRGEIAPVIRDDATHTDWKTLLAHPPLEQPVVVDPLKDIAVLQYTGGTTGVPKGAMLSHANVYGNAEQCRRWLSASVVPGEGKMMAVLPFFHVFAMTAVMNFSIINGMEMVLHPRFDLNAVLKDITRKRPTLLPGVPTMYMAINHAPDLQRYDLSSLTACISGGAALPEEVKREFEQLTGCTVLEGYGLTEASPVCCVNPLEGDNKSGSIGLPVPGTVAQVEAMEQPGTFLPVGEVGELCFSGPQVMMGYWQRPEATAEVLRDGVLRTGDIGRIDEEGYVYVVDRRKELIITSGFNVYPRVVEEAIYQHKAVQEAAVVGVDDDYRGEVVKAYIVVRKDAILEKEELLTFLRDKLGKHELPREIAFRDSLPKTMVGKINKKELV